VSLEFLWYIPNTVEAGHHGDDEANKWTSLDLSAELAQSAETQAMRSNYVSVTGGSGQYRSIPFRYVWPGRADLMAQLAGLRLRDRWDGWTREPFTGESRQHVSIWEKPAG
jgi:hypothetical protein